MKILCLMCVLLPLALAGEKRFLLDTLNLNNLLTMFSSADLSKYVNLIVDQVGSDATEQQCETACTDVMASDVLDTACPFICTSFQTLVHKFHIDTQAPPAKRFLLDTLNLNNLLTMFSSADLSKYVNLIVDQVGSDATEQQCETACTDVMASDVLDTACPFICTSFQTLVHKFHIDTQAPPAKRFLLDTLNLNNLLTMFSSADLSKYVNLIVDQVGSDATEQQCETACTDVMASDVLDTACPFICTSFQTLVHKFHIDTQAPPAKRFLLDTLNLNNLLTMFSSADLSKYVNLIVDQVGSDATEQQCETACTDVMASDVLDTACPFICTSFQTLVHKFHIDTQAPPAKRFLLDTLNLNNLLTMFSSADLSKYVNLIVDQVGSDATEQQCETACTDVMASDVLDTACPFICTSFQTLVHKFHIDTQAPPAKRFLLDTLNLNNLMTMFSSADLSKYVNLIVDQVGSDATEQQCETACTDVMASDVLDTACPFICTSFQTLVHKFHIDTQAPPAKRFLLDTLNLNNLMTMFSSADLSKYVNLIVDQVGSDATEQQCETACTDVMASDVLDTACPFICTSFQTLVHKFHIDTQAPPAKRFLLDTLNLNNLMTMFSSADLSKYVNLIVDQVGSDATEQQCETACTDVMASDVLDTACPFICTSFQTLVHKFHIDTQAPPAKRFLLDTLNLNNLMTMFSSADLSKYVNLIVDQVGSDATEQQCETACTDVMASDVLDTACPFICTSFQTLVHKFHIDTQAPPAKRFLLDTLNLNNLMTMFSSADLSKYVNLIVDQVGSDATEQQCETACTDVMASDVLDTACPFICTSFQTLVHKFHIDTQAPPAKRFLLDTLNLNNLLTMFSSADLSKYVNLIVDQVGSDATEQQCETACTDVMASDVLDTACPFICTSFQTLVHKFHIDTQAPPAKRFLLDTLNLNNLMTMFSSADLSKYVNLIVDQVGSDATEQQCETACTDVMASDVLDTACPFICTSFQTLVHKFHIGAAQPARRFLFGNLDFSTLLGANELHKYVNLIVDQVGSDATEQQCETACTEVMASDLLDTACPFICTSFQSLVKQFHGQPTPAPAKRFLLDSFDLSSVVAMLGAPDLDTAVNVMVQQVGSDATEEQCEAACMQSTDLPDAACPFVCTSFQSLVKGLHITEAKPTASSA